MDNYYALRFVYLLTRPWEDTDAFKLGLIDKEGNILKKREELHTDEEKSALTKFHVLVFNIKKLLEKVPLGKTTVARYAAALYLLKEHLGNALDNKDLFTEAFIEYMVIERNTSIGLTEQLRETTKYINEDGEVAGMGGSVTTGVDGIDGSLGLNDPSIKKSTGKKKGRQNLWMIKRFKTK